MSYIPDCRTDENYNQKYLNDKDKEFVYGFDWCVEMAVDKFFDNEMFGLADPDSYLGHILNEKVHEHLQKEYDMEFTFNDLKAETRKIETYADLIRAKFLEWIEMERDELITSMIDNMDDDEYEAKRSNTDDGDGNGGDRVGIST